MTTNEGSVTTASNTPNTSESTGSETTTKNTIPKDDIIVLKVKDIKLNENKEVTHFGTYEVDKVNLNNVRFFMSKNSIRLLRKTKKKDLLDLIAKARVEYDAAANKLLPKNAGTKPAFITDDVTIQRVINCYFDSSIRANMQSIGNSLCKDEIDSRDMKDQAVGKLLNIYNDATKIIEFPLDMCDSISTPKCIEAVLKFVNFHYKKSYDNWDTSGSHDNFGDFVGNKKYLEDYWKLLHETDDAILNSYATSELPEEVFNSSLMTNAKREQTMVSARMKQKKAKVDNEDRRTMAFEVLANSITSYYTAEAKEKESKEKQSFISDSEEKLFHFQNKLIEALEKKDQLSNTFAREVVEDQISFYTSKIEELKGTEN